MKKLILVLAIAGTPTVAQWLDYPSKGILRKADGKPELTAPTTRTPDGHPISQAYGWRITHGISRISPPV
jgi:hypothetical protein